MKHWTLRSTAGLALAIGSCAIAAAPASAKDAETPAVAPVPAPSTPQDAGQNAGQSQDGGQATEQRGIQDIIVTASRREETLQNAAIPVSAIGEAELTARGIQDLQQLTKLAPSLKIGAVSGGTLQITTRGVGTAGGNNFVEPGVSVNLDGAYIPRTAGSNGIFYDVQRVELLKGPQGTLYGRNTTGGVLNIITNVPTDRLGANVMLEAGNLGLRRGSAAINLPIADGIALRVAAQGIDRDGYLSDGYADEKSWAGRAKLKIDPTPELSILLEANISKVKGQGNAAVFSPFVDPNNPYLGPSSALSNAVFNVVPAPAGPLLPRIANNGYLDNSQRGLKADVNYDFGDVKATLVVNNVRSTSNYLQYGNAFPVSDDTRATPLYYTTAELRLTSDGSGPFKWVIGGFFFKDKNVSNAFVNQGVTFAKTLDLQLRTKSYSAFGEATYAVTPSIRLTAGGRYTSDRKTLNGTTLGPRNRPPAAPCFAPSVAGTDPVAGLVCVTTNTGQAEFNKFTYKLGVDADVGERSLVYANYSTGFKSGGFFAAPNLAAAGAFPTNAYRPENIQAWTVGSKNRFLDNTLQINVEGFLWKYKDKQVSHLGFVPPNSVILLVDNAGRATTFGAEIETLWEPTRNDDLLFNVQYQHSKYDSFAYNAVVPAYAQPFAPGTPVPSTLSGCLVGPTVGIGGAARGTGVPGQALIDCTGRQITQAPTWTGRATYTHTFHFDDTATLVPSISGNASSGFWIGEEYFVGQYQKSYFTADASLAFSPSDNRLTITAFVNNLTNETIGQAAVLNANVQRALVYLRPPRTYGIRANVRF